MTKPYRLKCLGCFEFFFADNPDEVLCKACSAEADEIDDAVELCLHDVSVTQFCKECYEEEMSAMNL